MGKIKIFSNAIKLLWESSKIYFIMTFIISIFSSIPEILTLIVWQRILDKIYYFLTEDVIDYKIIVIYILIHFILKISSSLLNRVNQYIRGIYSLKVEKFITNETIDAIELLQLQDMENAEIHNMIEKANVESSGKTMGLLSKSVELVQNVTTFIGMISILISFDFKVFLIIFLSIVPMALYSQKYYNKLFEVYDKRMEKMRYSKELKNMISKSEVFKEIKIFNSMSYLKKKINDIIDEIISEDRIMKKKLNRQGIISEFFELFFTYILKCVIIITGIFSKITIGTINMNMESATRLQNSTSNVVMVIISIYEDCLYLTSFSSLQDYRKKVLEARIKNENELISKFNIETIELVNISFKYKEDSEFIIKNFSYKFVIGKTYAIVGYNGGGKTTLVKIIMGLYKPQIGTILVNGKDINEYNIDEYLRQFSVVFQDFVKYPLTVRENIAMGCVEDIDNIERIRSAAEIACSDSFINNLPKKYEEKLVRGWEDSSDLSIGQWQRIAIARSNMRKGKLVILDEPSASLDAKTESRILNDFIINKTEKLGIVITHRFLNIKKVDEIIVLKDGEIDAYGNHEELLIGSPIYSELYHAQKEMI